MDIYTPLPATDRLDLEVAKCMSVFIKRDLRPYLLSRLAVLYSHSNSSVEQFIDRMEFELRLHQVDAYAEEVDAFIRNAEGIANADQKSVELLDLEISGTVFATCRTNLYFSPASRYFVHAPDSLLYIASLTEKLLDPSERIDTIISACWKKIILNNLRIFARDTAACSEFEAADAVYSERSIYGQFHTDKGRIIDFWGMQIPNDPVLADAGFNACALQMLLSEFAHEKDHATDIYRLKLTNSTYREVLDASNTMALFTLIDIVGIAMGFVQSEKETKGLCAKVMNITVPRSLGSLATDGLVFELTPLFEEARKLRPGLHLIPARFRFLPYQTHFSQGLLAKTSLSLPALLAASQGQDI